MSRAELIRRVEELEKLAPAAGIAFEHERLLHDLQVHQVELETQNQELSEAQRLIELSRDRYADLYDFAPVGYVTLDLKGVIREINLTAAGMLGLERSRLLGAPFHLHVSREDLGQFREHFRRPSKLGNRTITEMHLRSKEAGAIPVVMESVITSDKDANYPVCRATISNITIRRQAEHALRDNEARMRAVLETAAEAIITINEMGIIESFNHASEAMFGWGAAEVIGRNVSLLMPSAERGQHVDHLAKYRRTGRAKIIGIGREVTGQRRDGSLFLLHLAVSETRLSNGRVFTGLLRDITADKLAENLLKTRSRQQEAIARFAQKALASHDLNALLEEVMELVTQTLGTEFCELAELQPDAKNLLLRTGAGWKSGLVGTTTIPVGSKSQEGFTLLTNVPVIVTDWRIETRFKKTGLLRDHDVASGISVLICSSGKPSQVLGTHTKSIRAFTSDDVHFLQSIATTITSVIERRNLEQELAAISEREQRRIGNDLHDGICQELAGLQFLAGHVARRMPENFEAKRVVEKLVQGLCSCMEHTRTLSHGLSLGHIEPEGLSFALESLATNTGALYDISCHFKCEESVHVENSVIAMHLYRIAQEAIHNAIRHGNASRITIRLVRSGHHATLTVTDNGSGMSAKSKQNQGIGLPVMNYRAAVIGGQLSIESAGRRGIKVECTWKL